MESSKQHDGLIQVSSEVWVGTRFDIYLPVCPPQEAPPRGRRVVTTPRGTETVLLAEDDEIVRRLIVRVLKRSGYTVLVAEDGQQALDILEEKADEVAIAVLDVVMPKVSGRVVYERILEIAPSMPVLFCSGYSTDSLHTEFIAEQGLQVMPKPYNPDDLLIKMREMLDK
jgi:CheY-like chemotaxis protein